MDNSRVYDPLYGQIRVGSDYAPIVNSLFFRRLQHLRQLGLCYLAFPGGNHTRFEHSLGAYHLASFLPRAVEGFDILDAAQRQTLTSLLCLGTLCHDIGHGPFSHMTENVLTGLGASISHEEVGAAIVTHELGAELAPFEKFGITPKMVGQVMTKSGDSPLAKCAEQLVSSDLDLDRIDYLHRDAHYAGRRSVHLDPSIELSGVWQLRRVGNQYRFELTERGIEYAEEILFLRRSNYKRIVYESQHMCLTAMFEKVVQCAADRQNAEFGRYCNALKTCTMNWEDKDSVEQSFAKVWQLYGLVDYQAFNLLEEASSPTLRVLVRRIRIGHCFTSIRRVGWHDLHYLAKQVIMKLKNDAQAFRLRRSLEQQLAAENGGISPMRIACHLSLFRLPSPLNFGTAEGRLLEEVSALGRFLLDDVQHQYAIELFLDENGSAAERDGICRSFDRLMCEGGISTLTLNT